MSDEHGDESANLHHESNEFKLSLLEAFDRILASVPIGDPVREELFALRPEIIRHEETIAEAGPMIEKLEEVIKSDFAGESHRHISRRDIARHRAHRRRRRGLLLQRRSAHSARETEKGNARSGQRSLRDRRRSRIRNGRSSHKNHRGYRDRPIARRE